MKSISNVISNLTQKIQSRQENNKLSKNISYQKKNAQIKREPITAASLRFPIPEIQVTLNPEEAIRKLTPTQLNVFNYLIWMKLHFRAIGCSQSHIAKKLGVSRQTVNESLKVLHDLKFIFKGYRHMRTCFYNVSEFFTSNAMRSRLKHLLPSLHLIFTFSLALLVSSMSTYSMEATQSKVRIIRNYISSRIYHTGKKNMQVMQAGLVGQNNPISLSILNVTKRLGLTRWGQIKLSKFPDEVIDYAAGKLSYVTEKRCIKDEFAWFCEVCSNYCFEEKIQPDYGLMYQLEDIFKMPVNAEFVKEVKQSIPFDEEKYKRDQIHKKQQQWKNKADKDNRGQNCRQLSTKCRQLKNNS